MNPRRTGGRWHTESLGSFLLRSDRGPVESARRRLTRWLAEAPPEFARGVEARLWGDRDDHSASAFWELYLHRSLRAAGIAHEFHPAVVGTSSRPDFLVTTPDGLVYVEAVTLLADERTRTEARRADELRRTLDDLVPPGYFVTVNVDAVGEAAASQLGFGAWLRVQFSRCTPSPNVPFQHEADVERGGWKLRLMVQSWHHVDGDGDPTTRHVGIGGLGHVVLDEGRLIDALEKKAKHYGRLMHPFVVAVHCAQSMTDETAVRRPLYGEPLGEPLWVATSRDVRWNARDMRHPTWGTGSRIADRVDGVLFSHVFHQPWAMDVAPLLYRSPLRVAPAVTALPWPTVGATDDPTGRSVWHARHAAAGRVSA